MENNISSQDIANQMAYDFFKYHIDKNNLNFDNNISDYVANTYADVLYPSDTNSSAQHYTSDFDANSVTDSLIDYMIDHADDPVNNNMPSEWKELAKQQFSSDLNKFADYMEQNFSDFMDWLSKNPNNNQALPTLDDLMNFNPNDPNNYNPNDGYPLNPPSDDDNTNAPDSGNNNDEDNAPEPIKPPPPRDPLVLDTNKDGFISTIALKDSNAYFDITGDGIKERVSWIDSNDGILVYDKNESGKIDGIDEVFGNFTKNGFEELKELIDSNHDGKIDRQDELFN
ncbi:MAG: hypothetical protein M0P43_10980, partial [Arcobacteraceae bacterium]|nr:hypothetical protein [Arcobacteraceae bacterium]